MTGFSLYRLHTDWKTNSHRQRQQERGKEKDILRIQASLCLWHPEGGTRPLRLYSLKPSFSLPLCLLFCLILFPVTKHRSLHHNPEWLNTWVIPLSSPTFPPFSSPFSHPAGFFSDRQLKAATQKHLPKNTPLRDQPCILEKQEAPSRRRLWRKKEVTNKPERN